MIGTQAWPSYGGVGIRLVRGGVCRVSRWSRTGGTLPTCFRLRSFLLRSRQPCIRRHQIIAALATSIDVSGFVPNPCSLSSPFSKTLVLTCLCVRNKKLFIYLYRCIINRLGILWTSPGLGLIRHIAKHFTDGKKFDIFSLRQSMYISTFLHFFHDIFLTTTYYI